MESQALKLNPRCCIFKFQEVKLRDMNIYLIGAVEQTDEVFQVELQRDAREFSYRAIETLFNKAYEAEVGRMENVAWECGVAGVDGAVIWKATSVRGLHNRYLHVSFSDRRTR